MLEPTHTILQELIVCISDHLLFNYLILTDWNQPSWEWLHHRYWEILKPRFCFCFESHFSTFHLLVCPWFSPWEVWTDQSAERILRQIIPSLSLLQSSIFKSIPYFLLHNSYQAGRPPEFPLTKDIATLFHPLLFSPSGFLCCLSLGYLCTFYKFPLHCPPFFK